MLVIECWKRPLRRALQLVAAAAVPVTHNLCAATPEPTLSPPDTGGPVEIDLTLHIIKIYDVETVSESYQIEGYLISEWQDKRVSKLFADTGGDQLRFDDKQARKVMGATVWHPNFELVNIVGEKLVTDRDLTLSRDGRVRYNERFNGAFSSDMDFRNYPFDRQDFVVEIESDTHGSRELVFVSSQEPQVHEAATHMEEWDLRDWGSSIQDTRAAATDELFSRYTLTIGASHRSGFYVWRVLLPLLLIIVVSWVVFWMAEFGNQIGTATTLMLTVVAFNFYVSGSLPRLPYNTYIDLIIMSGYAAIFLSIIVIVARHATEDRRCGPAVAKAFKACRWVFPLAYLTLMIIVSIFFLK